MVSINDIKVNGNKYLMVKQRINEILFEDDAKMESLRAEFPISYGWQALLKYANDTTCEDRIPEFFDGVREGCYKAAKLMKKNDIKGLNQLINAVTGGDPYADIENWDETQDNLRLVVLCFIHPANNPLLHIKPAKYRFQLNDFNTMMKRYK